MLKNKINFSHLNLAQNPSQNKQHSYPCLRKEPIHHLSTKSPEDNRIEYVISAQSNRLGFNGQSSGAPSNSFGPGCGCDRSIVILHISGETLVRLPSTLGEPYGHMPRAKIIFVFKIKFVQAMNSARLPRQRPDTRDCSKL